MRILVGIEDTDHGLTALETTVERAEQTGDELTVAVYTTDGALDETVSAVRDHIETLDIDCHVERIESNPGSRLVELAEREGYDQIVLPGGHRSPLGKIKLDDVHEFVLMNSQTTVKFIR
jgi:nucleotide-binding universal stress UspA family protein